MSRGEMAIARDADLCLYGESGVWEALCFQLGKIYKIARVVYINSHEFSFSVQVHDDSRRHLAVSTPGLSESSI